MITLHCLEDNTLATHITILIGINDIAIIKNTGLNPEDAFLNFQNNYETLIKDIRTKSDCPITLMEPFIFPWPQEFITWYPDVEKISSIVQNIANKYHLQFVPTWKELLSLGVSVTTDGVHLSPNGHLMLANLWLNVVDFSLAL